ncbi:MAG: AMP-binding protein [Polyangia bacterium]|jgi:long-subunit acyl-CoA synthetase (AMP-forming)|nr:AMP-binding protein [Polyangia bacterium]
MDINPKFLPLESLYRHEKERPDAIYMVQPLGGGKTRDYTWKETVDEARRMAAHLKSLGYPPGSTISILSKNCAEFIISDLAIWMAGHVASAIYPTLDPGTVNYILTHSESKLLFVGKLDSWDAMKPGVPEDLPRIAYSLAPPTDYPEWTDIIAKTDPIPDRPVRAPEDVSLIFYTSGSTGRPKGVENTFANMAAAAEGELAIFHLDPSDRYISYLPMAHSFETMVGLNLMLAAGCKVFFAEALDTFLKDLHRAQPTLFVSVPRLWLKFQGGVFKKMPPGKLNRLLKIPILNNIVRKKILKGLGLDQVRFAISGSAPIPPDLIHWYRNLGLELLEGYGMTENFSFSHCSMPGKTRVGYVGNTWPKVECKIGENDEILVRGGGTMKGYHKMPEETAEVITSDGWLRTGDQGSIDEMGRLKITGRVKELFKTSKGKYIHPVPLENMLNAHDMVELSLVSGVGYPQPLGVVMLSEDMRPVRNDPQKREEITEALTLLRKMINNTVAGFEKLEFIAVAKGEWTIEEGHLTPTMKIKRPNLEKLYKPFYDEWYASKKPVIWMD